MKLGLGLYKHMLTKQNYQFAKQCGATHLVIHLVDYFKQGKDNPSDNQPTGGDNGWGMAYRVVGLYSLMTTAKFWSWFDWHGIDGFIDGSARCIRAIGRRVTIVMQRGHIQQTLYISLTFAAVVLISYVWL